jgi:hypothetical protein
MCFGKQAALTALILIRFRYFYKQVAPMELKKGVRRDDERSELIPRPREGVSLSGCKIRCS